MPRHCSMSAGQSISQSMRLIRYLESALGSVYSLLSATAGMVTGAAAAAALAVTSTAAVVVAAAAAVVSGVTAALFFSVFFLLMLSVAASTRHSVMAATVPMDAKALAYRN